MHVVEQSDAVGSDQRTVILLTGVEDLLLHDRTLFGLLAESGGDDDESPDLLVGSQIVYVAGTELGRNNKNRQVGGRNLLGTVIDLDALHLVFLWIDDT